MVAEECGTIRNGGDDDFARSCPSAAKPERLCRNGCRQLSTASGFTATDEMRSSSASLMLQAARWTSF
ncbi:hypothetical protein KCP70_22820 [Salmonella enterica subsp. enterica]|nr:hypothetical protein KCP70_22820 [Salmonella enterica subsp. enterica]